MARDGQPIRGSSALPPGLAAKRAAGVRGAGELPPPSSPAAVAAIADGGASGLPQHRTPTADLPPDQFLVARDGVTVKHLGGFRDRFGKLYWEREVVELLKHVRTPIGTEVKLGTVRFVYACKRGALIVLKSGPSLGVLGG